MHLLHASADSRRATGLAPAPPGCLGSSTVSEGSGYIDTTAPAGRLIEYQGQKRAWDQAFGGTAQEPQPSHGPPTQTIATPYGYHYHLPPPDAPVYAGALPQHLNVIKHKQLNAGGCKTLLVDPIFHLQDLGANLKSANDVR